jgi:RHS repeat-associated protein
LTVGFEATPSFFASIGTSGGTSTTTQDYAGGIEYKNNVLEAMYHAEGRAYRSGTTWQYEYTLKDHLGNSRVTFADLDNNGTINPLAEILQENHYYPFGLNQEGKWLNNAALPDTKYQYNGKELNEDLGLNWNHQDARWYDFSINRWVSVDPVTEGQEDFNPYHFSYNNPIRFNDPDGKEPAGCCGGIIDDAIAFTAGTLNAIGSNAAGSALRRNPDDFGSSANSAAAGQVFGDAISAVGGAVTAAGALLSAGAAAVATVGSGGVTAVAVAPALAVATAATVTAVNGAKNLVQGDRVFARDNDRTGKDFTKKGKEDIIEKNRQSNDGVVKCENCKTQTVPSQKSKSGITPPKNETQVDHKYPKSKGGKGIPENGQVLCRDCNRKKSNN